MTKRIATAAATAAIVFAMATPAFAATPVHNHAQVTTHVNNSSNSGLNEIQGFVVAGGSIKTGDATANSLVVNNVNDTTVGHHSNTPVQNHANVTTHVNNSSNSGENTVQGFVVTSGSIKTGDAGANSGVVNVVNTTVSH